MPLSNTGSIEDMNSEYQFEWDWANCKHILEDTAKRFIDTEEIESVFYDPFKHIQESGFDVIRQEQRFKVIRPSDKNRVIVLCYSVSH